MAPDTRKSMIVILYVWTFAMSYIVFRNTAIPTIGNFNLNLLSDSSLSVLFMATTAFLSSAATIKWKTFTPMYALGVLGFVQFLSLYPNFVHANAYLNQGSALGFITQNSHLSSSPPSDFLANTNFIIPGSAFFMTMLSETLGAPAVASIPLSNLIFVGIWFSFLPLTVQIRLSKSGSRTKYLAFVLFWLLMMNSYVLYEQGLVDHQFAEVLFAGFLLLLTLDFGAQSIIPGVLIFASLTISHPILAGVAMIVLILLEILRRTPNALSRRITVPCAVIFSAWLTYNIAGAAIILQGSKSIQALLSLEFTNNYLFHAATTSSVSSSLLLVAISDTTKGVLFLVVSAFIWIVADNVSKILRHKRAKWSVSIASGIATLLLLLFFAGSPVEAYGFVDRWLWIAPIVFPIALAEEESRFKFLRRLTGPIGAGLPIAFAVTSLSFLMISTALYWQPVGQQSTEAGFIALHSNGNFVNLGSANPLEFYMSSVYHTDSIPGYPFSIAGSANFQSQVSAYFAGRAIIIQSPYDNVISPAGFNYSSVLGAHPNLVYADGLANLYAQSGTSP